MALKDTCKTLKSLIEGIQHDLQKAEEGNKAAAQRVRTSSIKLEKIAKLYRKESIKEEKKGSGGAKKKGAKEAPKKASKASAAQTTSKAAPSKPAKAPAASGAKRKKNAKRSR